MMEYTVLWDWSVDWSYTLGAFGKVGTMWLKQIFDQRK